MLASGQKGLGLASGSEVAPTLRHDTMCRKGPIFVDTSCTNLHSQLAMGVPSVPRVSGSTDDSGVELDALAE